MNWYMDDAGLQFLFNWLDWVESQGMKIDDTASVCFFSLMWRGERVCRQLNNML